MKSKPTRKKNKEKNESGKQQSQFRNLKLSRIIVHEVLLASDLERRQPAYSEQFMELDPGGEELVCKRLADALGSDSHSVELAVELDDDGSPFQTVARLLDEQDAEFISGTKGLAARLTSVQVAGAVKAGIAVFIDGTMGSNNAPQRFLCVIKAETDSAFVKEQTKNGLLLKFVPDMVLGAQQRLHKIGFFMEAVHPGANDSLRSKDDFEVVVFDHQMSNTSSNEAARYFYGSFLGCRIADNAKRLTRIFYEQATEFIDSLKLSPSEKLLARTHLVSYLKSEDPHISVRDFGERYLKADQRIAFQKKMKGANFPARSITKDIKDIRRRLQLRRVLFTSKVRLTAPEEEFGNLVRIENEQNGWTQVAIKGSVERQK